MHFSSTFAVMLSNVTGRQIAACDLDPDLNKNETAPIFHDVGNVPVLLAKQKRTEIE